MKTVIIVSKCIKVAKLNHSENWYHFHFKGVCAGESLKKVVLKGTRVAEGLDMEEAYAIIMLVSKYVSDFAPILLKRYFNSGNPGAPPR